MIPGELHLLLERCRAGDAPAWERFAVWVRTRGRTVLGRVDRLSEADTEDALAEALKSLVTVVRDGEIRGASNAEIDAYVCRTIRNRALNVLRGRTRRGEVASLSSLDEVGGRGDGVAYDLLPDVTSPPDVAAVAAQQLSRAERILSSWPAADRYVFIAKLNGVSARAIQRTLEQPPFNCFVAATTIDSRFHRLRQRLIEHLREP